jgi:hypothetical protein
MSFTRFLTGRSRLPLRWVVSVLIVLQRTKFCKEYQVQNINLPFVYKYY